MENIVLSTFCSMLKNYENRRNIKKVSKSRISAYTFETDFSSLRYMHTSLNNDGWAFMNAQA